MQFIVYIEKQILKWKKKEKASDLGKKIETLQQKKIFF